MSRALALSGILVATQAILGPTTFYASSASAGVAPAGDRLDEIWVEAESGELIGTQVASTASGYSGAGYVSGFDTESDRLILRIEASAGLYRLHVGYATPWGEKGYDLRVNGEAAQGMFPGSNGAFAEQDTGVFYLPEGASEIVFRNGWGWYYLDYVRLEPTTVRGPAVPSGELVNERASPAARSLFSFPFRLFAGVQRAKRESRVYLAPPGGTSAVTTLGFVNAVLELEQQCQRQEMPIPDYIICPYGSGGTAAGIALGAHLSGAQTTVHAFGVCDSPAEFARTIAEDILPTGVSLPPLLEIDDAQGAGYGRAGAEELDLIRDVARAWGVVVDPCYTAKALLGLRRKINSDPARFENSAVVFVHTGGQTGLGAVSYRGGIERTLSADSSSPAEFRLL